MTLPNEPQTSDAVLMVRPAAFGFHAEAAESNIFANRPGDPEAGARALAEFDGVIDRLSKAGVHVLVLNDTPHPPKPDAVFPNNWVSFHADGTLVVYPMATAARRSERNWPALRTLLESACYEVRRIVDLSSAEEEDFFLEGTGSLIFDRPHRRAYASLSPRTSAPAIARFTNELRYSTFIFNSSDRSGKPIYHTNVLMSLGTRFALLCLEAVAPPDRSAMIEHLEASGRMLIEVDYEQLRQFACNLIELRNSRDEPVIALSSAAKAAFRPDQIRALEMYGGELLDIPIPTIEAVGGGSVRCMIADIHLPRRAA